MKEKKIPTAEQLAEAWRKSPGFGAPYWHDGKWVWLSPHGDAYTKCGSPIRPPAEADIKPHERQLWQKCWKCNAIRPWGGCGGRYEKPSYTEWIPPSAREECKEYRKYIEACLKGPVVILQELTDTSSVGDWFTEDDILHVASKNFSIDYKRDSLLEELRSLYREGKIEHKRNRSGQNCFRLKGEK